MNEVLGTMVDTEKMPNNITYLTINITYFIININFSVIGHVSWLEIWLGKAFVPLCFILLAMFILLKLMFLNTNK